jgi:hypothetical protein
MLSSLIHCSAYETLQITLYFDDNWDAFPHYKCFTINTSVFFTQNTWVCITVVDFVLMCILPKANGNDQ